MMRCIEGGDVFLLFSSDLASLYVKSSIDPRKPMKHELGTLKRYLQLEMKKVDISKNIIIDKESMNQKQFYQFRWHSIWYKTCINHVYNGLAKHDLTFTRSIILFNFSPT